MPALTDKLITEFRNRFGSTPRIFRSPGRINIIGEHTDYNDGYVLPAGIDRSITLLIAEAPDGISTVYSMDNKEELSFSAENYPEISAGWARYIGGVYDQLLKAGHRVGAVNILFTGDIPMGAGLSSSAALECAAMAAYAALFNISLEKNQLARLAQMAENEFVGVNCGIMDQFASVFSRKNQVIKLDCRDLSYEYFPLVLGEYELVLVDSRVKHSLASSEYNTRRKQCEAGIAILQEAGEEVNSLRDIGRTALDKHQRRLDHVIYRRCKYVVDEIERVQLACEALKNNQLHVLGQLLYDTHKGLKDEYEVSCDELDFLVEATRAMPYVLGSRMMGGGFGGCTINLVARDQLDLFKEEVTRLYRNEFLHEPPVYEVRTGEGTRELIS